MGCMPSVRCTVERDVADQPWSVQINKIMETTRQGSRPPESIGQSPGIRRGPHTRWSGEP